MSDCLDIAHAIAHDTSAHYRDRVTAIEALAELEDEAEIQNLVADLLNPQHDWPTEVKSNVLDALFPSHLSVEQFCLLLSQIEVANREVGGLEWHLWM